MLWKGQKVVVIVVVMRMVVMGVMEPTATLPDPSGVLQIRKLK